MGQGQTFGDFRWTVRPGSAARGAGAAGTRGTATAAAAKFEAGGDRKPHVGHVDRKRSALFDQIFFDDKLVPGNFDDLIRIARLVQSQRQPRAASAARGKIDADGTFFFFRKIPVELGFCVCRQFNHGILLEQARSMLLSTSDRKVK
jgi:hypothetical protein